MSLVHGRAITAEELERVVGREFSSSQFASLCNAVAWAASRRRLSSLPSFTERVNVTDDGIDAEWDVYVEGGEGPDSPLLGPGWNVFQYKKRDVTAGGRQKVFAGLKSGMSQAVLEVYQRTGRRPDRYVLFTNLDLMHETNGQKGELRKAVLNGYDRPDEVGVNIVGAGELAAFVNDLPHVRSAYFACDSFASWEMQWERHKLLGRFGANVDLVGRKSEVEAVRSFASDSGIRAMIAYGPHQMGKSRLALEGTKEWPIETVFALDAGSLSVQDLLALRRPGNETLVVIEDPEAEAAQRFVEQALAGAGLKVLITLPTAENAPAPSFGRDDRVRLVPVAPLSDSESEELLRAAGGRLDFSTQSWVVEQAGGNPGVLLLAASLGDDLIRTTASFVANVARAFRQRIQAMLGDTALEALGLLSVLTHVDVSAFSREPVVLGKSLGRSELVNKMPRILPRLEEASIVRRAGSYVEVVPPLLANDLAETTLVGRTEGLLALFAGLGQSGRLRLVRRLRALGGPEVGRFWEDLFDTGGLLGDLSSALENAYLLRLAASAVPDKVAGLVYAGLRGLTAEGRLAIAGHRRRELMWTLEELLFRKTTSEAALRCLALLAEAESEPYGNNATGVFRECFHPLHPQLPLELDVRAWIMEEVVCDENSTAMQVVGLKAIEYAVSLHTAITLRRSAGRAPFDPTPLMMYGQVRDYLEQLADLLMAKVQSDNGEVAKAACEAVPQVVRSLVVSGRLEGAMERLERVVDMTLAHRGGISVSSLAGEVGWLKRHISEEVAAEKGDSPALEGAARRLGALKARIDGGDFETRVKRWTGRWGADDYSASGSKSGGVLASEGQIQHLAKEGCDHPELVTEDLLEWLCSPDAQKAHIFLYHLGREDSKRLWQARLEQLGSAENGVVAFSGYFGGMSSVDREGVSLMLDELTSEGNVGGEAILRATAYMGGDADGVKRVETVLTEGRVDPRFAERILSVGGWIAPLAAEEFLRLLRAIAGSDMQNALSCVDLFGMWMPGRAVEGELEEFAWQCLERAEDVGPNDGYRCDLLASTLAKADSERGFRLLETLLLQPYEKGAWNPIARHGEKRFWNQLLEWDRPRCLRSVLSLALKEAEARFPVTWNLRETIDQVEDGDFLVSFALESERHAAIVSESIAGGRPGFWPIALRIAEHYAGSDEILASLASSAEGMGRVFTGPWSLHLGSCRLDVERVLNEPATPPGARPWLQRLEASLRERAEQSAISETDEEVNDLRRVQDDPAAPERLWAIKRLVSLGSIDDLLGVMTKDELLAALRTIDLADSQLRAAIAKVEAL
jgi:hypothetical protein